MLRRSMAQVVLALGLLGIFAALAAADGISTGYVQPAVGDQSIKFCWRVKFWENMNAAPEAVYVIIFDEQTQQATWNTMWEYDPSDTNLKDGKWYTFSRYLHVGEYRYRFLVNWRSNLYFYPARATPTQWGWLYGPTVTPVSQRDIALENGSLSPAAGTSLTDFTYQVRYFGTNNLPPDAVWVAIYSQNTGTTWGRMQPANPSDTYYRDGALYYYTTRGLDTSGHAYRFAAQRGGQWVYYPEPQGSYLPGPTIRSAAEYHIREVFRRFSEDMNNQDEVAALTFCSDGFRHHGCIKDTLSWRLDRLYDQTQYNMDWELTNLSVSVNGDQATASYHLIIRRIYHAVFDKDVTPANDPFGLAHLRNEGGFWRFCGNQQTFGAEAKSGVDPDVGKWVEIFVRDDLNQATAVSAAGPGITGSAALAYGSRFDRTGWWLDADITDAYQAGQAYPPFSYQVTVSSASGDTVLNPVVTAIYLTPPWGLKPTGVITGGITYSWWTPGFNVENYTVQLFAPGGAELWQAQDQLSRFVPYDGPALYDETLYPWRVRAFDADENFAQGSATFTYVLPPP